MSSEDIFHDHDLAFGTRDIYIFFKNDCLVFIIFDIYLCTVYFGAKNLGNTIILISFQLNILLIPTSLTYLKVKFIYKSCGLKTEAIR